jgi:TonB family protein
VRLFSPNRLIALTLLAAGQVLILQPAVAYPMPAAPGQSSSSSTESTPGIELLTDPKGVDVRSYLASLFSSVKRKWYEGMPASARRGDKGVVSVQFRVQKDGKLLGSSLKVSSSSGKKDLDDASLNAIRKAAPFDHLPSNFPQPFIEMRLYFQYNMGT